MPGRHSAYDGYIVDLSTLPFSFVYDEVAYTGFPVKTFRRVEHRHSVQGKKERNLFVLKAGDLQVTVDTAFYAGYEAYEWTVWFENTGVQNLGVIRNIRAADMFFDGERPVLKGILGDHENEYQPYTHVLEEAPVRFPLGQRTSDARLVPIFQSGTRQRRHTHRDWLGWNLGGAIYH